MGNQKFECQCCQLTNKIHRAYSSFFLCESSEYIDRRITEWKKNWGFNLSLKYRSKDIEKNWQSIEGNNRRKPNEI